MLNKPEDNFAFKDDKERVELQDKIRSTKLALEAQIAIYGLIAYVIAFIGYCIWCFI